MEENLSFLKSVWTVFSNDPQKAVSFPMEKWVDEQVYAGLGQFTSVDELTFLCETKGLTTKSFEKAIESLNKDWSRFSPEGKKNLIRIIKIHKLEDLVNFELRLTHEEQEELRIRWDISDILYFEKKQEAINLWREYGLDVEKGDINISKVNQYSLAFPEVVDTSTKIALSALKYKLEFDLAVVSVAAPSNLGRYTERIEKRLNVECLNFTVAIRDSLTVLVSCFPNSIAHITEITAERILGLAVSINAQRLSNYVAKETAMFILELGVTNELKKSLTKISETQPNYDVCSRVQEMIKSEYKELAKS